MVISTSDGITAPRKGSRRCRTSSPTVRRWFLCALRRRSSPPGRNLFHREANVLRGLLAAIGHLCHVTYKNRLVVGDAGGHVANVLRGAQELTGLEEILPVAAGEFTRSHPAIGKAQCPHHLKGGKVVS